MHTKTPLSAIRLPYLKDFKQGLYWNLFDSVGTQGLLILYHVLFRNCFGAELHGKVGCTLSVFYLGVIVLNLGLDYSLAPFLEYFTKTKRHFITFLLGVMVPQLCFLIVCMLIVYSLLPLLQKHIPLLAIMGNTLTSPFLLIMCCAFLAESLKKTAKYLLQLTFYTPLTALVDVTGMLFYVSVIFISTFLGVTMTLEYIWLLLLLLTATQFCILCVGIYTLYRSLPSLSTDESYAWHHIASRFIKTRFFAWSNQCINQLFSGNFLVPICALHFGLEQASLMKVITSISSWITLIANKVFGITGNALLAHVKTRSLETQQRAFDYISFLLTQALYFLVIFLTINGKKITLLQTASTASIQWSLLYFMLIISFFESFFILYEKWYIIEEKASIFFIFNLISFGVLYMLYPYTGSAVAMLAVIIAIRFLTFFVLTLFSFYRWHIWPSLKPNWRSLLVAFTFSGLFYVFI